MTIGMAMNTYFQKLKALNMNQFGTAPTFPWEENPGHNLFVSPPDEEGYAQWLPKMAAPLKADVAQMLCDELQGYYGSWYFLQMSGRIKNINFNFFPLPSAAAANQAVKTALAEGRAYFPQENCVLLATCNFNGIDDMLLFYVQNDGSLFIYDPDTATRHKVQSSLCEIIANMEALI